MTTTLTTAPRPGRLAAHSGGWRIVCLLCPAALNCGGCSKSVAKDELRRLGWFEARGKFYCPGHRAGRNAP